MKLSTHDAALGPLSRRTRPLAAEIRRLHSVQICLFFYYNLRRRSTPALDDASPAPFSKRNLSRGEVLFSKLAARRRSREEPGPARSDRRLWELGVKRKSVEETTKIKQSAGRRENGSSKGGVLAVSELHHLVGSRAAELPGVGVCFGAAKAAAHFTAFFVSILLESLWWKNLLDPLRPPRRVCPAEPFQAACVSF